METAKTFSQQAEQYMHDIASDVRPATLHVYRSILDAQLIPEIGREELSSIGNKTAKSLVTSLTGKGLSPATIRLAVTVMKQILASATNDEGEPLYPRQWNAKFIKAPKIGKQNAPVASLEETGKAVKTSAPEISALICMLGGTALRIGEALATYVENGPGNVWDARTATITVSATETPTGLQNEPKTDAGNRVIDLPAVLNDYLKALDRKPGELLFQASESTYRRALHVLGLRGFHSLRRMRITYLDGQSVPRSLVKFWAGHAAGDVSERYMKGGSEIAQRKDWAEKAGLGFSL